MISLNQIAKVQNCKLEKVGELPFRLAFGACAANSNSLILCFNYRGGNDERTCHASNDPTDNFMEISKSNHEHCRIRTAASEGKLSPFAKLWLEKWTLTITLKQT